MELTLTPAANWVIAGDVVVKELGLAGSKRVDTAMDSSFANRNVEMLHGGVGWAPCQEHVWAHGALQQHAAAVVHGGGDGRSPTGSRY